VEVSEDADLLAGLIRQTYHIDVIANATRGSWLVPMDLRHVAAKEVPLWGALRPFLNRRYGGRMAQVPHPCGRRRSDDLSGRLVRGARETMDGMSFPKFCEG